MCKVGFLVSIYYKMLNFDIILRKIGSTKKSGNMYVQGKLYIPNSNYLDVIH